MYTAHSLTSFPQFFILFINNVSAISRSFSARNIAKEEKKKAFSFFKGRVA
jgi:MFS-type transporter involved in bile tolerance (Atg22 family)